MKERQQFKFRPSPEIHQILVARAKNLGVSEGVYCKWLVSLCYANLDFRFFELVKAMCHSRGDKQLDYFGPYCQQIATMLHGSYYENPEIDENGRLERIFKFIISFIKEAKADLKISWPAIQSSEETISFQEKFDRIQNQMQSTGQ